MKLRLPHKLQAALIATLASVSFTTLSSGTLAVATGAALLAGQQAQAEAYNGVEYSGDIFTIENKTSQQFHGATFSNLYWDGTGWVSSPTWTAGGKDFYSNGTKKTLSDQSFWYREFAYAGGTYGVLGNTIRLTGATADTIYESTFNPFVIGGIIAEASDYTYVLGRSTDGNISPSIQAMEGQEANLTLDSSLILSSNNGVTVASGGTWKVADGKSLQFGRTTQNTTTISQNTSKVEFSANVHVDMIGGGVVDITRTNAFILNTGATISVGEGTTLRIATTGASVYGKALVGSGGGATAEAGSTDAFTKIFMGQAVNVQDGGKLVLVGNVCFNDTVTGTVDRTSGVADLEITGSLRSNVGGKSNPWVLGDHKMKVGGDFWLTNQQHFNLAGGTIEVGGALKLGHEGNGTNGNYKASLNATAGSTVKLHDVMFYGGRDVLSVDGSSITFTKADGNVLSQDQTHVPTAAADLNSVSLNNATLVAQENGWTLDSLASSTVTVRGASKLDIAGGNTIQIGHAAVSGSFTALEGSTGTLQLNDATFTGTVGITGANVGVGGTVTLDLANFGAFEVADATGQQYSYNNVSGFLTASGKYYLVHAAEGATSTATWSGSFADGSATYDEASSVNGNIVFSLNTLPPSTSYYVNADMDTRNDVTGGTNNLLTKATDVYIKKGVTLTAFSVSDSFTNPAKLHGEGTYALARGASALNSGLSLGTDWTGTVVISNAAFTNQGLSNALNNARNSLSWVKAKGLSGWNNTTTINANLILENGDSGTAQGWAYMQDNGNTGQTLTFAGMIKGDGKMGRSNDLGAVFTYEFTNDISGWTGTFESRSQSGGSTTFRVKDNATVVKAILDNKSNNLYVDVQNNATFNAEIKNATKLTIASGKTATLAASATLGSLAGAGALVVDNGSNTVTVNGSNNYTGSITVNGGTLALGNHQFTGVPSLTINDGGTVTTANNNGSGLVGGTVTINAGGTLKATGGKDIFGYETGATDKVVMQGSAEKEAKIDLSGVTGGSVTMTTDLEMKGYSTISGGAINSLGGSITVSGTNNTISSFDMRDPVTIDVAADGALEIGSMSRFTGFSGAITKTGAGSLTLKGGVIDKAITMSGGTLALDGTFTVDGIAIEESEGYTYYGGKYGDDPAHSVNGERWATLSIQLANGDAAGNIDLSATPTFMFEGSGMVGEVSTVTPGQVDIHSTTLSSTFYINQGTEETAWIKGLADEEPFFAVVDAISLAGGTTLVVNDNAADGFDAGMIHMQGGAANLQIEAGNKVIADGTDRALQLSGAGEYKLNGSVRLGSLSTAASTAATPWTGTIDATVVGDGTNLLDLLTNTNIHGGTVQLQSKGNSVTPSGTETALQTNLANQGRTGDFTLADTTFTTGGAMRFNDWQNNHVWTVGSGSGLQVGGDLWMDHGNKLAISGGNVTVGGKLLLGHSGGNKPTGLEMTGGSFKATQIDAYSSSASPQIPVSITGGTVEFTGTGNVLQIHNSAVCDVNIGGTGDNYVTLKADGTSWSLAYEGMTIGNIIAETANGGAITLGTAGKAASYTGKVEVAQNSILTLDGILTLGANGIVTSGVLGVSNTTVFNLEHMEARQEGDKFVYHVFTGDGADLSTQDFSAADNIIGITTTGKDWTFGDDGTISYVMLSSKLVWQGTAGSGVWDTTEGNQPWLNGETPSAFRNDDEVTFDSTYSTAATATLGGNVEAASITVAAGANVRVAQAAQEAYTLAASSLVVNGTLTSDMPIGGLKFITVGENATWNTSNALDITDNGGLQSFSNAGTIKLLSGASMDVDMTAGKTQPGVVTAAEGGTLHLHNVPGSAGTFDGHDDFLGTLVYDVVSAGNHNASVVLTNFGGTLELRGRLGASDCDFGGMTKLVLNGDRPSNNTGLWNSGAFSLDVPVDIVGNERVDLYVSAAMTITGDVNSGTERRGHLGKQNNGALTFGGDVALASFTTSATGSVNFNGDASLASMTVGNGTVNMGGTTTIDTMNVSGGTANLSGGATLGAIDITGGTVNLSGADKAYSLGETKLNGGNLAVGATGVGSLTATDLIVIHPATLSSAAAEPTVFNVTRLDVSNYQTNFTLRNVTLNVSDEATAAVLNTAQNVDEATTIVDTNATLNLNGSVVWNKEDTAKSKTDYVNLTIANGGTVNVNGGMGNILNDVTVNAGGKLNFKSGTGTEIAGALALADTITNGGSLTIHNGSVAEGQVGTLTGNGAYTVKGTVAAAGSLKLDGITVTGEESAAITGNVEVAGGTLAGAITLGSADSTIRVSKVFTAAENSIVTIHGTMVLDDLGGAVTNYTGAEYGGNNGFISGVSLTAYTVGTGATVTFDGSASYKDAAGRIENGVFTSDSGSMTTFIVTEMMGDNVETYSHAKSVGGDDFVNLELAAGTSFIIDSYESQMADFTSVVVRDGDTAATVRVDALTNIISVATGAGLTFTGDSDYFNIGSITGTGLLTIDGPTVSIMNDNSSFAGGITVNAGYLSVTSANALGSGTITANEGGTIQITATDQDSLPGTLTVEGQGDVVLIVLKNGTNVNLKAVDAANLHLVADSTHNSRFVYNANSDLSGVDRLYFDGAQLWLNTKDMTGDNKFTGNVTFNTTAYSENNVFGGAAIRVSRDAEFSGSVNVQENTKLSWEGDKTLEFSGTVTGSGNLDLARYSGTGTFKVSGNAAGYQGAITSNSYITLNVADSGSLALGAGSNLAGAVTLDGTMTVAGNSTISGAVSGTGSLVVDSGATLTLGGAGLINVGTFTMNSGSYLDVSNITQMAGLTVNLASYTNSAFCTDANITGVNSSLTYTLNTTGGNVTLTFASTPSPTPFKPVADLGNVMYVGDSITDGVSGMKSWRYSFFQVLADGGIAQNEEGYHQHHQTSGAITTTTYGGRDFQNTHSAQSSARSYEVSGTNGPNVGRFDRSYIKNWLGQDETKKNGDPYPTDKPRYSGADAPNTYFMLLGTNDLLSEGGANNHVTEDSYNTVLSRMFGYNGSTFDGETGSFDVIWDAMTTARENSKLIVMEMPTWNPSRSGNHDNASDFAYMAKFNQKLHEWVNSQTNKDQITIVNPNPGIVDVANTTKPGAGVANMFISDGLHPSAQGELIIAGNVAQQLGYAGRSIGLTRAEHGTPDTVWTQETVTSPVTSEAQTFAQGQFNTANGYTVDFGAAYGNGITDGWSASSNALSVQVGDGTHTGTLTFSEAYVMWGNTILYSRDNSQAGDFRIAYVNQSVNASDNVSAGYYVWMGDMLIGEALTAGSGDFNGIQLTSTGANGTVSNLTWSDTAYAPTTKLYENEIYGERFHLVQIDPSFHDNAQHSSLDIDFSEAPVVSGQYATNNQPAEGSLVVKQTNIGNSWFGPAGANHTGDIAAEYTGVTSKGNLFGAVVSSGSITVTGDVSAVVDGGASLAKGSYDSSGDYSVFGSYQGTITGKFSLEINDATLSGGVMMGVVKGNNSIASTDLHINSGAVINGDIFGGNHSANGTITGNSDITITGGTVNGSVYGGNMDRGTIGGNTSITITGGIISGDVTGGNKTGGTITGSTNVTVEGYQPFIGGNINAQNVTLKNVAPNGQDYEHGFDYYAGTITATNKLTLDNYTVGEMLAKLDITRLAATNGTVTTINHLGTTNGVSITVDEDSSLTVGDVKLSTAISNDGELTLNGNVLLDMMTATHTDESYVDGNTPGNGFYSSKSSVSVFATDHMGNVNVSAANMTYKGAEGTMDANGVFTTNEVTKDLTTFYINAGSENLTTVTGKSADATVTMDNATRLVVDEAMNTNRITVKEGATGTLDIQSGVTVTSDGTAKHVTLTGSGVYALQDNTWALLDTLVTEGEDHWKGIVRVSNVTTKVSVSDKINGIMDTTPEGRVELMNVTTGFLGNASHNDAIITAGIILTGSANGGTGTGFAITDGYSGHSQTFTGSVSGHGDLVEKLNPGGTGDQNYIFQGDISQWDGSFKFETSKGAKTVTYSGNAWQVASGISQTSTIAHTLDVHYAAEHEGGMQVTGNVERATGVTNALNLHVDEDATFTGEVKNASSFTVAEDKTATLQGEGKYRQLGNVTMEDNASLNIMNIAEAAKLSVGDVTIGAGATMGVYTDGTLAEANVGTLTITDGHNLTAGGEGAKLNANLVMETGSTLDVSAYGGTGGLNMGCSVTLNPGMSLSPEDMAGVDALGFMKAYDLYYDVESFFIGDTKYSEITFASETWVKASDIFDNTELGAKDYYVFYSGVNRGGNGNNVGTIYIVQVPEPTTSTLSLLALCALAARRRRK